MTAKQLQTVKRTTVRLPVALAKQLAIASAESGDSQQQIIGQAVTAYLKQEYAGERDK